MSQKPPKKPKKPTKYLTDEIRIEKLIPGGQALGALADGKKIMLWGALPGEIVTRVRVTKEKPSFVEGIATEVAQTSTQRVAPRDACYLATSPWQILDYRYEMTEKVALVKEVFRQHGIAVHPLYQGQPNDRTDAAYEYRNKMEYALYYDHGDAQIHLAFHERGSHRKVPIASSSLERPEIFQKAQEIVAELNQRGEDARKYQSLLLRCNQNGEVSGGLFENHRPHPQFARLEDELCGIKYSYSPNGFFQINLPVYKKVLESIRAARKRGSWPENVLDLYSGVGTIGLSVARDTRLTLVECDRSAYDELVANVQAATEATGNSGIKPVLAKSEDALAYIESDQVVIVDPPRAGCRPEVIERFLEVKPQTVIYLSCNPATQARDLKLLLPEYEITSVETFNFFPRTPHIENLVILVRKHSVQSQN